MIYLKTYENYSSPGDRTIKPNFKEGDYVICIDDKGAATLREGEKYKVKNIINDKNLWKVQLDGNKHETWQYFAIRFLTEIDYNMKKYNI